MKRVLFPILMAGMLGACSSAPQQPQCAALAGGWQVQALPNTQADAALATNNDRVRLRPKLLATLRARLAARSAAELSEIFEAAGLPFAPIRRPEDLYDDPHLVATGGLADVVVADGDKAGQQVKTTLLPITMQGQRLGVRLNPPRMGEHTQALLQGLGYSAEDIQQLRAQAAVA